MLLSGTFFQPGTFGKKLTIPFFESIRPGNPKPIPEISLDFNFFKQIKLSISATRASINFCLLRWNCLVSKEVLANIDPERLTNPNRMLVPPTSTPTV